MSSEEEKQYLFSGDWIAATELLAQTMPAFKAIDLIIEGCIGGNEWCAYWLKKIFPNCVYAGADIAPAAICLNTGRVDSSITPQQYEKLLQGQDQLKTNEGDASLVTFRANCLSPAFVASLKELSGAQTTLLVTFNGLVGLMGREYVPGERKGDTDFTSVDTVVNSDLYDFQLHIMENDRISLWDSGLNVLTRWYYQMEAAVNGTTKRTMRIKDGLLLL